MFRIHPARYHRRAKRYVADRQQYRKTTRIMGRIEIYAVGYVAAPHQHIAPFLDNSIRPAVEPLLDGLQAPSAICPSMCGQLSRLD